MIVADASALVELLLGGPRGLAVERHLLDEEDRVQVPALLDAEVAQAMRRLAGTGTIDDARGRASLEILQEMPLHRHLVAPLLPRIWDLKHNLTAYDAAYVALAESLECPVLTFDTRLRAAPGIRAEIIVPAADPIPPTV